MGLLGFLLPNSQKSPIKTTILSTNLHSSPATNLSSSRNSSDNLLLPRCLYFFASHSSTCVRLHRQRLLRITNAPELIQRTRPSACPLCVSPAFYSANHTHPENFHLLASTTETAPGFLLSLYHILISLLYKLPLLHFTTEQPVFLKSQTLSFGPHCIPLPCVMVSICTSSITFWKKSLEFHILIPVFIATDLPPFFLILLL